MGAIRYVFPISYVFFVVLIACTVVLYDPFGLTQEWVLALVAPAIIMSFITFWVMPVYEWAHYTPDERNHIKGSHKVYHFVLALVMLVAPLSVAMPVLALPDPFSWVVLGITVVLLILNSAMLLFATFFVDESDQA